MPFYEDMKREHPTKVLLVRVSSVYAGRLMSWTENSFSHLCTTYLLLGIRYVQLALPRAAEKRLLCMFYCEQCHCCSLHCTCGDLTCVLAAAG